MYRSFGCPRWLAHVSGRRRAGRCLRRRGMRRQARGRRGDRVCSSTGSKEGLALRRGRLARGGGPTLQASALQARLRRQRRAPRCRNEAHSLRSAARRSFASSAGASRKCHDRSCLAKHGLHTARHTASARQRASPSTRILEHPPAGGCVAPESVERAAPLPPLASGSPPGASLPLLRGLSRDAHGLHPPGLARTRVVAARASMSSRRAQSRPP